MTDNNRMRSGSLQFYPRVRSKRIVPRVNWKPVPKNTKLCGFIGYKVAMVSVWAKDDTPDSMTKGKRIAVPSTILECPPMKIYSARFYRNGKVAKEVLLSKEKVLKRKVRLPKEIGKIEEAEDFDDVRVILYSEISKTGIGKKKPDMAEFALSGSMEEKIAFIKENIGKEINISEIFSEGLVDTRAVTRGFGTQGPVKRFGIALKDHKSEKGRRRPGSLAPWHPARVTFRAPQAGQTGFHKRISYNNQILEIGKISEKNINPKGGFQRYGEIKTEYIILRGSVMGPKKRAVVITPAIRPTKKQEKKKLEVLEIR